MPGLAAAGHEVPAPDLPTSGASATVDSDTRTITDAIDDRSDVVVVGRSMGAFTRAGRRDPSAHVADGRAPSDDPGAR